MNVLFLVDRFPPDRIGGVWETAYRLRESLQSLGHRVFVLTTGCPNAAEEAAGVYRVGNSLGIGILKMPVWTSILVRRLKIDLIHAHQPAASPALLPRIFRRLHPFPSIVSSYQVTYFAEFRAAHAVTVGKSSYGLTPVEYLQKFIFAPCHILADLILYGCSSEVTAVSTEVVSELKSTYGRLFARPVRFIKNGALESDLTSPGIEKGSAVEKGPPVVLFAGAFRSRKGMWHLLDAFASALTAYPNARLELAGAGRGYESLLRDECRRRKIEGNVKFYGAIPHAQLLERMAACDVFCLPSRMEGLPLVVLEAMALGRCIVTTSVSGMRDILADGVTGLLVPPDDEHALASALSNALGDESLRKKLGEAARAEAKRSLCWETIAEQFADIYQECLRRG